MKINTPGFTAENSLLPKQFYYSSSSSSPKMLTAKVEAQMLPSNWWTLGSGSFPCTIDGVGGFTCHVSGPGGDDPGGWGIGVGGGSHDCVRCRSACLRIRNSSARQACLENCADNVC